ncbi:PP2C family protein-serine/threonine phosphatase [Nocardioides sp. Kera G14]|uniref:PP2C family protein-serine/threonine phosphatase n=1 Tax=Nocardioides sp. Kera G14 TaxID=2884264 RepID=UPI001D118D58|nr:PP2C family protein-serine/threonine phosphatase [Nocardioides sp. Kera G14]UDY24480.1 serine/threonine-protein phosphatase [Nocardioides sp. Kera G14]
MNWRRQLMGERGLALLLAVMAVLFAGLIAWQTWASLNLLLIPLVIASLLLSPRLLSWFVVGILALAVLSVSQVSDATPKTATATAVVFALGLIVMLTAFRRVRLGVAGVQGESMFVDLRDRILRQAKVPDLPEGWMAETAITSAGGTLFAGDFIVAARTGDLVEIAVVDVSGKGEAAGSRALLLCGALGGLIGSIPPDEFLCSANAYLLRQEWEEGFATAVHLVVDVSTGDFQLRTAGHPPALRRVDTSGRWERLESHGVFLGLLPAAVFDPAVGTLAEGEAIMMYTDGVVEEPTRDIDVGIDLLAREAERQVQVDLVGAAQRLVTSLGARDDDRTMVVVHRL